MGTLTGWSRQIDLSYDGKLYSQYPEGLEGPSGDYAPNHPNFITAVTEASWVERLENKPYSDAIDLCTVWVHQGNKFETHTARIDNAPKVNNWRVRNPKAVLVWHRNLRWMDANKSPSGTQDHERFEFVIEGGNWHLVAHKGSGQAGVEGLPVFDNTVSDSWVCAYWKQDFRDWEANRKATIWGDLDADGSASIAGSWPIIGHDNWPAYWSFPAARNYHTKTGGIPDEYTITGKVSGSEYTIPELGSYDESGPPDGEGYTPLQNTIAGFYAANRRNTSRAYVASYKDNGNGTIQIRLSSSQSGWEAGVGDNVIMVDTNSSDYAVDFGDPPTGNEGNAQSVTRQQAAVDLLQAIQTKAFQEFGYWTPYWHNDLSRTHSFWATDSTARERVSNPFVGNSGITHCERYDRQITRFTVDYAGEVGGIQSDYRSQNESGGKFNDTYRDWMVRILLFGDRWTDKTNPSTPTSYMRPTFRGIMPQVRTRKLNNDGDALTRATQCALLLDELDAAYLRFYWAFYMQLNQTILPQFGTSYDEHSTPLILEEQMIWPGDPESGTFPHTRWLATCTFDDSAIDGGIQDYFETVNWRPVDFGDWGFWTEFPEMLVYVNLRQPDTAGAIWVPHHLSGGQTITPSKDRFTPPSAGTGKAWYRFDSDNYTNPNPESLLFGKGPATAPFTVGNGKIVKDNTFNDGSKVTGTIDCGALEGGVLIRGDDV